MNITELIKEAHDNAIEKGFYDCPKCKGNGFNKLADMCDSEEIKNGCDKCPVCNGSGIDPNKNIGELLMLIVSELGEALEAHRCGRFFIKSEEYSIDEIITDMSKFGQRVSKSARGQFEEDIKDTFEDEIADVFIRLFDLCGYLGIELKTYPKLEMKCFKNTGQEFLWWTATLSNLPGFVEYYKEMDDIGVEIEQISLIIKRMEIFCQTHNIPIEKHIKAKMTYNKTRPHKHGKEY